MVRRLTPVLIAILYLATLTLVATADDQTEQHDDHLVQCHQSLDRCVSARNQIFYAAMKCKIAAKMIAEALVACDQELDERGVMYEVRAPLCTTEAMQH